MSRGPLRIGSRASALARVQAEWVAERAGCLTAMVWIRSQGDADRETPLSAFGGVGVFTKALDEALLGDRVDCAVHSLKDLPTTPAAGTTLACVSPREDVRDVLVSRGDLSLAELPSGARVGTGSNRRRAQLLRARPDLEVTGIRGNVGTRLAAVKQGTVDAVVLAAAGLKRLGREAVVSEVLEPDLMLPAAGQAALGLCIREGDAWAEDCLAPMRDLSAAACTDAERRVLAGLEAGCHAPVGTLATVTAGRIHLRARVLSLDGTTCVEAEAEDTLSGASRVASSVVEALLAQGAGDLVRSAE